MNQRTEAKGQLKTIKGHQSILGIRELRLVLSELLLFPSLESKSVLMLIVPVPSIVLL